MSVVGLIMLSMLTAWNVWQLIGFTADMRAYHKRQAFLWWEKLVTAVIWWFGLGVTGYVAYLTVVQAQKVLGV